MTAADNWRPSANAARLRARADLLHNIRSYFASQQVMEVETPILSAAGNTDPEINSIRTQSGNFLRTSPEFPLKRLLA
ncbi:MAG: EF-P lysine aminoacylase GenX, partial [Gammaproteobacteria bacterium]|nr:EF-P lysine aminoacylase GenX [Gammaproteobacteria bacterium]